MVMTRFADRDQSGHHIADDDNVKKNRNGVRPVAVFIRYDQNL